MNEDYSKILEKVRETDLKLEELRHEIYLASLNIKFSILILMLIYFFVLMDAGPKKP